MIFQRWYRELGGLAAFLLILYGAVAWTNRSIGDGESSDVNASQMTKARLYSDSAWRRGNFANATVHLNDLLVADPHNSHARFKLAECYYRQFTDVYFRLNDSRLDQIADPTRMESMESTLKELGDQAVELYRRCTKSHRYRGEALFHLAILSGMRKEREEALGALDRFLSLNYSTNNGIAQSAEFAFLLDDPEFQRLIVIEQRIKQPKNSRQRPPDMNNRGR